MGSITERTPHRWEPPLSVGAHARLLLPMFQPPLGGAMSVTKAYSFARSHDLRLQLPNGYPGPAGYTAEMDADSTTAPDRSLTTVPSVIDDGCQARPPACLSDCLSRLGYRRPHWKLCRSSKLWLQLM